MVKAQTTGWVRGFGWMGGGGGEGGFPVCFINSLHNRVARVWALEFIQFKSWGFPFLVHLGKATSPSLGFLS